ncbi:MAG: hypothetical protein ACOYEJ_09020 [Mahellales bacterium]|jgi:hypothetical protein
MFLIGEKARPPFATVWNVEDKGNYVQGRISTSEKDQREEGKYINSNWFARFVGKAKDESMNLKERDRIKILSGKVTNVLFGEGENRRSIPTVVIFDFEMLNNVSYSKESPTVEDDISDDDIPF